MDSERLAANFARLLSAEARRGCLEHGVNHQQRFAELNGHRPNVLAGHRERYLGAAVVGCLLLAATRVEKWAHLILLSLLAIQVALNAVYDIRVLFLIDRGQSDAAAMARIFLLPSWVWAMAWMLTSLTMLGATLWMTRGPSR